MGSALLVGIDAYLHQPLRGCVNDVEKPADFFVFDRGFERVNVKLLTDDEATEVAFVEGLRPSCRRRRLGGPSRGPPL